MPPDRHEEATPSLDALSGTEHAEVLAGLLTSHPDLRPEAELTARRLLDTATVEAVADEVAWTLGDIPLDAIGDRVGYTPGRGYIDDNEAAWELLEEAIEPFLADLRRRADLDHLAAAATIAVGTVAGLYQVRGSKDGTLVAYNGEEALVELAREVLEEATRLGVPIPGEAVGSHWPQWAPLP